MLTMGVSSVDQCYASPSLSVLLLNDGLNTFSLIEISYEKKTTLVVTDIDQSQTDHINKDTSMLAFAQLTLLKLSNIIITNLKPNY